VADLQCFKTNFCSQLDEDEAAFKGNDVQHLIV